MVFLPTLSSEVTEEKLPSMTGKQMYYFLLQSSIVLLVILGVP